MPLSLVSSRTAYLVSVLCLLWSLFALGTVSDSLDTDPLFVRVALAVMGLFFLGVGFLSYRRAATRQTLLFWFYGAFSCMHWGGVIGDGEGFIGTGLLAIYALFASAMPQSIFCHLALLYSSSQPIRPLLMTIIYTPVILSAALLPGATLDILPTASVYLGIGSAVLYSVIGGIVWMYKVAHSRELTLHARILFLGAFILGWSPHAMINMGVFSLGDYNGLAALSLILIPLAIAHVCASEIPVR